MSNPKTARAARLIAVTLVLAACNGQPQPELSASEIQAQEAATVIEEDGKDYTAPADVPEDDVSAASAEQVTAASAASAASSEGQP
ncbi:hypothetical protein NELON_03595 [Neisseria elongata subsp. glycolytica ATCC 29315]|uniref:Lipoprotein n=1 Tax=Neisseria elongata subsp. glycolytica ATCC 29315 TaxID=546263 RepID=A0A0B5CL16_NEIEG|nr:hypothetical protein [Neisseria elongata]AJE18054.1 hypothetical protein NELON_03595 [Neisseria elongata subsp. glycolytica ATCC 29315]SQH49910.1 Uncharacterised protein [Neisseria elongata subsp. glycolytica]